MATKEKIDAFLAERRNLIVVGIRRDGRPHATPNWFVWDGQHFYVSTTRTRAKYVIFQRDPRAELVVDDSTSFRCVILSGHVALHEDVVAELPHFQALRQKYGESVTADLAALQAEQRVLLVITPDAPQSAWTAWGLD